MAKIADSSVENLLLDAGKWQIKIEQDKLRKLSASSKQLVFNMKEGRAKKDLVDKKYRITGKAFVIEAIRYGLKDNKKHNLILPVTVKYSSYKDNMVLLRSVGKNKFKPIKKIKHNRAEKEVQALVKSVKQTLVLATEK